MKFFLFWSGLANHSPGGLYFNDDNTGFCILFLFVGRGGGSVKPSLHMSPSMYMANPVYCKLLVGKQMICVLAP